MFLIELTGKDERRDGRDKARQERVEREGSHHYAIYELKSENVFKYFS